MREKIEAYLNKKTIFFIWLLALIIKKSVKFHKQLELNFFSYLLALLAREFCFCLVDLSFALAISGVELIDVKVAINFSCQFWYKEQINFFIC